MPASKIACIWNPFIFSNPTIASARMQLTLYLIIVRKASGPFFWLSPSIVVSHSNVLKLLGPEE
jgi:hypothetical protein|eukprot:scaffold387_cov266-Chaetoceros_neogracile.AAC.18